MVQALAIQAIKFANAPEPLQSPGFQLRPPLADAHKITAHMRPAKGQEQRALFHLSHRFIAAVPIYQEHAAGVFREVIFRNVVAAEGIQDVHHRIAAAKHPQPPGVAYFPVLVDENQPACLVGLGRNRLSIAFQQSRHDRLKERFQAPQTIGHRSGRQIQSQELPLFEQPFRRPLAGKLVDEDFQPHRHSQKPLGYQLGHRRRRPGPLPWTLAAPFITTPRRHAAIDNDIHLHLLHVFRTASYQRQAAVWTDPFGFRQGARGVRSDRQVAIIPALVTRTAPLVAARPRRLGRARVIELIGAIAAGLLFRLASERLRLEFAVLAAKVLVFLFQHGDAPHRIGMPALPISRLLAQFEILTPQAGHLGPQLGNFSAQLPEHFCYRGRAFDIQVGFEKEVFHDPCLLPKTHLRAEEQLR